MVKKMKQKKNVYIVGAGKFGKVVLQLFREYGKQEWNVMGFLDNNTTKHGKIVEGYPVFPIKSECDNMQDIYIFIAVFSWESKMELVSRLTECQYKRIYVLKSSVYLQKSVFFSEEGVNPKYALKVRMAGDGKVMPVFGYIETHVMNGCNLKCKGCTHFSNLFPTEEIVPIEIFERNMVRLREICDVEKLRLMGGEPLLNRKLLEYIKIARENFPYSDIRIVTNGLLIPKQSDVLFSYMREHDIIFDISWYPPTVNMQEKILQFLSYKGVKYYSYDEKIQYFSAFLTLNNCHDPMISQQRCGSATCTILRDGKLYKCPLSAYLLDYREKYEVDIDIKEGQGIDIFHDSIERVREFSINCIKEPINMCRYCSEQPRTYLWSVSSKPEMEDWLAD